MNTQTLIADAPVTPAPAGVQDWLDAIAQTRTQHSHLRIVGGQTKQFLCASPIANTAVLDTRSYTGVVAYEPSELVLTARAGTPLAEVEAALAERGQALAFEPPHFGSGATLGGAIAAGLSGPARASVGAARDFVLGAHLVNGRGEYMEFGGQVMKNVAGYDVSRLLAGSWGTLGVLAQVSVKVLPVAPGEATLHFELDAAAAIEQLARWRAKPLPLNASAWLAEAQGPWGAGLWVRLRGAVAAVEAARRSMLADAPGQDTDAAQALWTSLREQTLPVFEAPNASLGLWRTSVAQNTPPLPDTSVVEWHGGQRWLWAAADAGPELQRQAQAAGGHAQLFRLPAQGAAGVVRHAPPQGPLLAIHQRLKDAFDPDHVFNRGVLGVI
jgi:glycolate oxidase FAD binding subunit